MNQRYEGTTQRGILLESLKKKVSPKPADQPTVSRKS